MKQFLFILIFSTLFSGCDYFQKKQTDIKKETVKSISQNTNDLVIKLTSPIDTTHQVPSYLYNEIDFMINDSVSLFNYKSEKENIIGYQDKICEIYSNLFIFKLDDSLNPNKYLIFKKEMDKIEYYGITENVSGEIFGDVDYDGKFEIGGYTTFHTDSLISRGKYVNNNFKVYELNDSIRRDKNIELKFFITIDSLQLAEIKHKVFDLGITLFEKDCSVGCECDCGTGSIIFLDNDKFIESFYCMPDMDYYTGSYKYRNNKISLTYKSRSLVYTPLNDEVFNEYELKVDTILTTKQDFDLLICNDSIIIFKGKDSYLKEAVNMKFDDVVAQYKNNDVWNMLEIDEPYKEKQAEPKSKPKSKPKPKSKSKK